MFITQTYTPLQNCLNSGVCTDESDFWNNILNYNNLIEKDTENTYYTIYYQFENNTLYYIRSDNPLYIRYDYNGGIPSISLRFVNTTVYWKEINYSFNSSGEITGVNRNSNYDYTGTDSFGITAVNSTFSSIILATNQDNYLYNYTSTPNNSSFSIQGISGIFNINDTLPIIFTNGTTYHWNTRDIFTPTTTYCYPNNFLGQLENVSAFSVVVKGKTNTLNHNLTGSFDIISNKNVAVNEWNTQFNANVEVTGRHQMNCINNRCEINFDYNIEDDIDEDITLVFTYNTIQNVSMPTRIQFNSCSNYDNISEIYYTYINDTTGVTNNNDTSLQNNINDTNINGANGYLNDLLNNEAFKQDNGLLAIIQAPINFINSLSSKTCQSFNITIPFINATATIPCMSTIYDNYLGSLFEIIRIVINGVLCYRIALSIVLQVKDAKNPDSDKIEVIDL